MTLLDIIESNAQQSSDHVILNYALELFWNLIDESHKICEIIAEKKGLDLFFLLLEAGLPPFAGAKTGRKNIRVPSFIFTTKLFLNFVNNIHIQSV